MVRIPEAPRHVPLVFEAPGVETVLDIAVALGPDVLRAPPGPLLADASNDEAEGPPGFIAVWPVHTDTGNQTSVSPSPFAAS